MSRILIY